MPEATNLSHTSDGISFLEFGLCGQISMRCKPKPYAEKTASPSVWSLEPTVKVHWVFCDLGVSLHSLFPRPESILRIKVRLGGLDRGLSGIQFFK